MLAGSQHPQQIAGLSEGSFVAIQETINKLKTPLTLAFEPDYFQIYDLNGVPIDC